MTAPAFDRQPMPPGGELVECGACGFRFDAIHARVDGHDRDSCPCCEESRLSGALHGVAEALGPDVVRRWDAEEEGPDLAAEVRRQAAELQRLRELLAVAEGTRSGYRAALAGRLAGRPLPPDQEEHIRRELAIIREMGTAEMEAFARFAAAISGRPEEEARRLLWPGDGAGDRE